MLPLGFFSTNLIRYCFEANLLASKQGLQLRKKIARKQGLYLDGVVCGTKPDRQLRSLSPTIDRKFFFRIHASLQGCECATATRGISLLYAIDAPFASAKKGGCSDPSAGSPTETVLRLLLPLNAQVWESSRAALEVPKPPKAQSKYLTKTFNR